MAVKGKWAQGIEPRHFCWIITNQLAICERPGGFGANHHLRQSFVFLNVLVMAQPEAYISGSADLFDDNGEIQNEGTGKFLQSIIDAFLDFIEE